MFDIGFPELFIVALVMLVVLGPERLPETLRTAGLWLGRLRRSFASVKAEIEKEVGMDDIKRQLHNEAIMDEMKRLESEVRGEPDAAARNALTEHGEEAPSADDDPSADPSGDPSGDPYGNPEAHHDVPDDDDHDEGPEHTAQPASEPPRQAADHP